MKLKLLMVIVVGVTLLSYLYSWYMGELVPAWQAAVWTLSSFIYVLDEYLTARLNSLKFD